MLNETQKATLKAAILADQALLNDWNDGNVGLVAQAFREKDPTNTQVWWSATPTDAIFAAITWDKFTPTDAVPNDTAINVAVYQARQLAVQTKQMNLQNMLISRQSLDARLSNIRAGLRDAVIQLPTGSNGAMTTAGGTNGSIVLAACIRPALANRAEKLFSAGASATSTTAADVLTFEGELSFDDIQNAMSV